MVLLVAGELVLLADVWDGGSGISALRGAVVPGEGRSSE
jgi:hypothetical protein